MPLQLVMEQGTTVTLAPHFPAVCSLASCLGTIPPSPQPDRQLADSLLSADTASWLWVFTVLSLHGIEGGLLS